MRHVLTKVRDPCIQPLLMEIGRGLSTTVSCNRQDLFHVDVVVCQILSGLFNDPGQTLGVALVDEVCHGSGDQMMGIIHCQLSKVVHLPRLTRFNTDASNRIGRTVMGVVAQILSANPVTEFVDLLLSRCLQPIPFGRCTVSG